MIAGKHRLAEDAQDQIDELEKQIADSTRLAPGQTAEGKQLADARRRARIDELRQRKADRLAEAAQIQAEQQATMQTLAQLETDARERQLRKQQEFLRDQRIAQLKLSGDKIAIAQAEADKFLAIERRKIADTFIMQDAATQQQKQLALRQAQDAANAKVEEARREVAEDEKKKREAEAKEKQKSLKDLKKEELSIEETILEAGAKKLENMNQLIQLTMFLHKLQRAREVRAANAVRDVFATREKIAKLEEAVAKNPDNINMQKGLKEAQSRLVFEEAFAGKKLNEAGISDVTRQAFQDLSTGIHAALESSEVTLSVISTTLVDSLQVQRDILAAIYQKLGWSPQQGAPTPASTPASASAPVPTPAPVSTPPTPTPPTPPDAPVPTPAPDAPETTSSDQAEYERKLKDIQDRGAPAKKRFEDAADQALAATVESDNVDRQFGEYSPEADAANERLRIAWDKRDEAEREYNDYLYEEMALRKSREAARQQKMDKLYGPDFEKLQKEQEALGAIDPTPASQDEDAQEFAQRAIQLWEQEIAALKESEVIGSKFGYESPEYAEANEKWEAKSNESFDLQANTRTVRGIQSGAKLFV